jgi:dihydrodipicolinate synthase/N-acetylneuraminate lyase
MYQHFKTIAEKVDLPVILYNVPGRTVADLAGETTVRLAGVPGIVGIKDATGNLERGSVLLAELKAAGHADFTVLSGDDLSAILLMFMVDATGTPLSTIAPPPTTTTTTYEQPRYLPGKSSTNPALLQPARRSG